MSEGIPGGWSVSTIGQCCDVLDSKRIPINSQERASRKGIYPYYGANGRQDYIDDYIFDGESVLLAEDGGYFDEWDSRPIAYLVSGKYWVNNHAHILQAKNPNITKWVYYSIVHKNILKHINGGTRAKLNQSDMREVELLLASVPEQKKITSILASVDEVIEKTESQISKLQDLKKGMMQELLTKGIGHTEFKDSPVGRIPKGWSIQKVGDLAEVIDPQPDHRTPPAVENGVPYVGMGDIGKNGDIDFDNARKVSQQAYDKQVKGFDVHEGAFIFGKIGTIGNPSILPKKRFYCLSANIILITSKDSVIQNYLLQVFQSHIINSQVADQTNTTSQPALGIKKVRDFVVPVPSDTKELNSITGTVNAVDRRITSLRDKHIKLSANKKALMQDLLTGKVRVKVN